jgi:hypothetical protein
MVFPGSSFLGAVMQAIYPCLRLPDRVDGPLVLTTARPPRVLYYCRWGEFSNGADEDYAGASRAESVQITSQSAQRAGFSQEAIAKIETLEGMVAVNNITIDEQQHQLSTLAARLTALESA